MSKYFVTFGQRYHTEPHPHGGHPDGYFTVEAYSRMGARQKVFKAIGMKWAFIYDESEFNKNLYPRGELKSL